MKHMTSAVHAPTPPLTLADTGLEMVLCRDILLKTVFRRNLSVASEIADALCVLPPVAMELIEMARMQNPDHPDVQILYDACQAEVEKINLSEITSLDLVPHVKCSMEEIMKLNIDHRVGFLISQIDGFTSLSDLMILTGFNETELINAIGQLKHQDVIRLE